VIALPKGFAASGVACGLKPSGKPDVGLLVSERPATAVGVFTTNRFQAAPVTVTRRHLRRGSARAVVVNAGNANACTGRRGIDDATSMAKLTASALGLGKREQVLVNSTGVIGQHMDMQRISNGIRAAAATLSPAGAESLAAAMMTTDTRPKTAAARVGTASIVGFAKGAGMMAPEMATMLVFLATDAAVDRTVAAAALQSAVRPTFNSLNLDGCMSTNDTVLLLANGAAGGEEIAASEASAEEFTAAVADVCASLSRQIADDGEGMSKLVTVRVDGASDGREARRAADAVAGSILLRCALNGADPYWGRVLAALGTSKIPFDPNVVDVWMGGEKLAEGGTLGSGDVEKARRALADREIEIVVDMHRGPSSATVLTNDLSVEYVRFNTEYTT
jgi:glutamate N-acetyltransferase / amino-acid N-acetyltransferase